MSRLSSAAQGRIEDVPDEGGDDDGVGGPPGDEAAVVQGSGEAVAEDVEVHVGRELAAPAANPGRRRLSAPARSC